MSRNRNTEISQTLAQLLRHGAQDFKLDIRDDGYCRVSDVLKVPSVARLRVTVAEIEETVANCPRQRFALTRENNQLLIRATQGHSIKSVSDEKLLVPLDDPALFPDACHATYLRAWDAILRSGLSRMNRNHIHLSSVDPGAAELTSGLRSNYDLVIFVDLAAAMRAGIRFFLSENQVILTEGNESGVIPAEFFTRAMKIVTAADGSKTLEPISIDLPEPGAVEEKKDAPAQRHAAPKHSHAKPHGHAKEGHRKAHDAAKHNKRQFRYLVVLDFEATCDEDRSFAPREIIEFPMIIFDTETLEDVGTFHTYIRPQHHPIITPFCTQLTGITQAMVDQGGSWAEDFADAQTFLQSRGLITRPHNRNFAVMTCGDWDLKTMLPDQCRLYGQRVPEEFTEWINIKAQFEACYGQPVTGMTDMLNRLGLPLDGRHHSGIDDVKNIVKIAKQMIRDGHIFEITSRLRK